MTRGPLADWIRTRRPAPPPPLLARIEALSGAVADVAPMAPAAPVADVLLDAAERAMRGVLHDGCLTRDSAIDLLAIDAIVTYAFEAAADDPELLDARTRRALERIAGLAEPYPA